MSEEKDWQKTIDEIRMMRWEPKYHGSVPNPSAPGGKVDMWILVDSQTGESIVSLAVPHGRSDIAGYVAACCGNPVRWVTEMDVRDPRADSIDDPGNVLRVEATSISDALFKAYGDWLQRTGRPPNGYTLNDALSWIWYAYCAQLDHPSRGRLLFRFLQLATQDFKPEDYSSAPAEKKAP